MTGGQNERLGKPSSLLGRTGIAGSSLISLSLGQNVRSQPLGFSAKTCVDSVFSLVAGSVSETSQRMDFLRVHKRPTTVMVGSFFLGGYVWRLRKDTIRHSHQLLKRRFLRLTKISTLKREKAFGLPSGLTAASCDLKTSLAAAFILCSSLCLRFFSRLALV